MAEKQKITLKNAGEELALILMQMTDEEKAVALAMIQGMQVGKKIAEQEKQNKSA